MPSLSRGLAVLSLVLLGGACAHAGGPRSAMPAAPDDVALDVQNHTWSDVGVFVIAGSADTRIGDAGSMSSVHLHVPPDMLARGESIRVRAVPVGGGAAFVTEPINVLAGQRISISVETQISQSTWQVERTAAQRP